jgi:hypothetical protein
MTGFALGMSATAGLWSALVIGGTALLLLGVVMAVSATLPAYSEKEKANRTEWGLIVSVIGAAMVLIGTTEELRRHVGWLWLVLDGVILAFVAWGVFLVLKAIIASRWRASRLAPHVEAFLRARSHPKVSANDGPNKADKHAEHSHHFGQNHNGLHDAKDEKESEESKEAVDRQAGVLTCELPDP